MGQTPEDRATGTPHAGSGRVPNLGEMPSRKAGAPQAKEVDAGLRSGAVDVDTRPMDARATALADPWRGSPPVAALEGEMALEVLPEVRRITGPMAIRPSHWPHWWWAVLSMLATVIAGLSWYFLWGEKWLGR